jgi:ankyrin repeat protein
MAARLFLSISVLCLLTSVCWADDLIALGDPEVAKSIDDQQYLWDLSQLGKLIKQAPELLSEPCYYGETILSAACKNNAPKAVAFLLRKGAFVHIAGADFQAIHSAPTPAIAQLLVAAGASLETVDIHGKRPLHHAVENSRLELVRWLLKQGVEPSPKDKSGKTPLDYALESDDRIRSLLLKRVVEVTHG